MTKLNTNLNSFMTSKNDYSHNYKSKLTQKVIIDKAEIMAKVKLLDHFLPLIVFLNLATKTHIYDFIIFCFSSIIFIYDIMIYQIMHSIKLLHALNLKAIFKND